MSGVFITFSGNCKEALTFYQLCFGGKLEFEIFTNNLGDYEESPVVSGSLISSQITIYGSDLVHQEGRILGNYMAIYLYCKHNAERKILIQKLKFNQGTIKNINHNDKLIEIIDAFEVRWILAV